MCNWRAWLLPGLVTVALLTALAIIARGGQVEQDLSSRAAALFSADGVPWASATLDGRDLALSGTAPTQAAFDAAIQSAGRVWGVRTVTTETLTLLPLADPYTLTFQRTGDSLTVSGSFPDGTRRTASLDALRAALPALTLTDETGLARGAPQGLAEHIAFLAPSLAALSPATATLEDGTLTLEGAAPTVAAYEAELARLASPPAGLAIGALAIDPPTVSPYTWEAVRDEAGVTLSGFVPGEEARAALLEAAAGLGAVTDRMERGFGAPEGFAAAAIALLGQMAGLDTASASLSDRALSLAGDAADHATYDRVAAFLGTLPQGFDSLSGRIAPPLADPFETTMAWEGTRLTLTGVLPDETSRAVLANALEAAGHPLDDGARIARGAPRGVDMPTLLETLAVTLTGLAGGEAVLSGDTLTVRGDAIAFEDAAAAQDALAGLASDALAVTVNITPGPASPYTFSVAANGGQLTLSGFAPSAAVRDAILSDLAILFPGLPVEGDIAVAEGAPDGFQAMVAAGLRAVARLADGRLSLVDRQADLSGDALYLRSMASVEAAIVPPEGFALSTDIGLVAPPAIVDAAACQARLEETLAASTILFETGSAAIDGLSLGLLDRLVRTLQSCPDARVEIAGHTNSDGADAANQALSEARAEAVHAYVTAAGIDAGRLTARGYGEARPVADNATEEGRAQNRRIAFTVQP